MCLEALAVLLLLPALDRGDEPCRAAPGPALLRQPPAGEGQLLLCCPQVLAVLCQSRALHKQAWRPKIDCTTSELAPLTRVAGCALQSPEMMRNDMYGPSTDVYRRAPDSITPALHWTAGSRASLLLCLRSLTLLQRLRLASLRPLRSRTCPAHAWGVQLRAAWAVCCSFAILMTEIIMQRPPFEELYLTPLQARQPASMTATRTFLAFTGPCV